MEYNVLIGDFVKYSDRKLFFGPLEEEDEFLELPDDIRWPQLIKTLGIFDSTSEARRNGWDKDIEEGWSRNKIGKKSMVYVLKITRPSSEDWVGKWFDKMGWVKALVFLRRIRLR